VNPCETRQTDHHQRQELRDIPENKFTVTVLGAVAELERAKIIERTTRGRLHKLRRGELSSNGHRIYGYDYARKSATAPAALVVNEEQAAVVRSMFEMFASGECRLVNIARYLERSGIRTRLGRSRRDFSQVKSMLKNEPCLSGKLPITSPGGSNHRCREFCT
jgi:site-specific DNA recombinase